MKSMHLSILAAIVSLCLPAQVIFSETVTVTLDVQSEGIPFSRDLLGVNLDTEDSLEPNYSIERYYHSMGPLETPVIRFPGGLVANSYHWVQTLGPTGKRIPQWNWDHTRTFPPICGAGDYLKLLHRIKARGMISLNICDGTPQEAAAWVAFCRGRIGDTRAIGKDKNGTDWKTVDYWAKKRLQETGLLAPVDVLYWELGNEAIGGPKFNGKEFNTSADYCPVAREFARAIRPIDPNVFIGWLDWNDKVMGDEKDLLDFIIIHNYTGLPVYGDKIMMWHGGTLAGPFECTEPGEYTIELKLASNGVTPEVIKAKQIPVVKLGIDGKILKTMTLQPSYENVSLKAQLTAGNHRVEVTFTNDYGAPNGVDTNVDVAKTFTLFRNGMKTVFTFPDNNTDFRQDLNNIQKMFANHVAAFNKKFPHAFTAVTEFNRMECNNFNVQTALYAAEFLRICAQSPRVQTAEIWEACSWNFGLTKSCAGELRRPTFYTYLLMKDLLDRQIPVAGLKDDDAIRILATRNSMGREAAILIINLDKPARTIHFSLPGGKKLLGRERKWFTGPSLTTDNESGEKIKLQTQSLAGEVKAVEVPPYSLTLILGTISEN